MSTSNNQLVIGVAGTFSSGQDSFCHYLEEKHNFMFISTSDMVREAAMDRYGSIERPILQKTGLELRREQGGGVFAEKALRKFRDTKRVYQGVVIAGVRSLGELQAIKKAGGYMVFTDAPIELRYERMKSRGRDAEIHTTLEEFKEREAFEASSGGDDHHFNRDKIKDAADYYLNNDGTYEDFTHAIEVVFAQIRTHH